VQSGINLSLSDRKNTALWHRTVMIAATIGIDGLEDPLYLIGSSGKIVRVITPTNVTSWNISALSTHLAAKTFVSNPSAPSFLHRLEGNVAPSPNGIETLVDTNELDIYGEQVLNRSSVDYIYFGTGSTKNYKIHNITDKGNPYFKLDTDHLSFYSVLGYNYTG
jgi:hypothetical protein